VPGPWPVVATPEPPRGNGLSWLGYAVLGIGAIVVVAMLRRVLSGSKEDEDFQPAPTPGRVVTRPVTDGFWIDSPSLPVGTTLHYRCRVGATMHEDRFTVAAGPGGLFVYTGGTPTGIQILEILPPTRLAKPEPLRDWDPNPPRATHPWPMRSTTQPTPPRPGGSSPGRSGYPSAY
jgi:hypothetical protein